ncbi:trifunctional hydroxymethylpyrimidine kinase/phosphomethylpyrimidine kinase/thiaminase [Vermiconidia calcicola]|uniref:Trifunctional hydroxymethylpyrimidine kinase/phosphomethylpyrimidine kinase/thiaminase n=1 Tax=Vermiconidia calcicola TaxID=1690605 RepID=A0ACC3NW07_9PEZI|nr:trifunctional hydroxymethylpyrimidine kinase/phosphomethylpyrimidine kinase/thiaminase [Vermiconidia calcicola]
MKLILVIAGTDSSGGAGLEADQKVIAAHGCYAMTAQAALTAQNTLGVNAIHEVPSDFVKQQIDACIEDIGVDVVKTGMLASASTISIVADALRKHKIALSVVDPVMVATTGAQLLPEEAVKTLCYELLRETYILTPNIPEANLILKEAGLPSVEVRDLDGLKELASAVHGLGPKYVLLKGGHIPLTLDHKVAKSDADKKIVVNVLLGENVSEVIESQYQSSRNTHGTGCTLASAIACNLAQGATIVNSVRKACRYVDAGIRTSPNLGKGSGPLNHFHSLQILPFAPGTFVEYILDREDVKPAWREFTHHEFVRQMGDGTLPEESFKYYMIQDYLYLAASIVTHIRHEIELHLSECKQFGLTQEQIESYEESQACTAYSRYCLDIGQSEDWLALQISLLPCLLGYSMIAKRLDEEQKTNPTKDNRYRSWIDTYIANDYSQAVEKGRALMEKHAGKQSPSRIEELVKIFVHATKMEVGFWEMASKP